MATVRKSLFFSFLERFTMIALALASSMIIARLLTPEDIGLYGVAAALMAVAHIVRDFGISSYLIQEKHLTEDHKRTAFTLTLIIGITLFAITRFIAEPVAAFYEDERMIEILLVMSVNFLIIPFNATTISLLMRDMNFPSLFWIRAIASVTEATTAITLALNGFGYMSLAWAALVNTSTLAIILLIYKPKEYWYFPTLSKWRKVLSFGAQASLSNMIFRSFMYVNDIVIGKVLNFAAVAILSRASGIMFMFDRDFMQAIQNVAYPAFAQANRENADLENAHTRSTAALTAIAWPCYGFLSLYALETVRFLYGHQWDAAAPLIPVFCLAGAVAAMWKLNKQVIMAMGYPNLTLRAEVLILLIRIATLTYCALNYDTLMPYAVAFLIPYLAAFPIYYYYKSTVLPSNWPQKIIGLAYSALLTLITLALPVCFEIMLEMEIISLNEFQIILIAGPLTVLSWFAALKILNHPIIDDPVFPEKLRRMLR